LRLDATQQQRAFRVNFLLSTYSVFREKKVSQQNENNSGVTTRRAFVRRSGQPAGLLASVTSFFGGSRDSVFEPYFSQAVQPDWSSPIASKFQEAGNGRRAVAGE
jgi:hypothetical protein